MTLTEAFDVGTIVAEMQTRYRDRSPLAEVALVTIAEELRVRLSQTCDRCRHSADDDGAKRMCLRHMKGCHLLGNRCGVWAARSETAIPNEE